MKPHARNSRLTVAPLISPNGLRLQEYCPPGMLEKVVTHRRQITDSIKHGTRFNVIVGPCSVRSPSEVLDYVQRLSAVKGEFRKTRIIIRLAGEKPRTALGWPGFIQNPGLCLDEDGELERGLAEFRRLLISVNAMGLPIATEVIDPDLFQYYDDLVSLAWIGARTVTSPQLRFAASGFSMPVLFKNNTNGSIQDAANAVTVAGKSGHSFASIDDDGNKRQFIGKGNPDCSIALRGGDGGPNFDEESVQQAHSLCGKYVFVDVNHANSGKDHTKQPEIASQVASYRQKNIKAGGIIIESDINPGSQQFEFKRGQTPAYGVSITDACIGIEQTIALLRELEKVVS